MSSDQPVVEFRPGDDVEIGFLFLDDDGAVYSIEELTVTAVMKYRGSRGIVRNTYDTDVDGGIVIDDVNPVLELNARDQLPHGTLTITEEQTELIPRGIVSWITFSLFIDGLRVSSRPVFLSGIM